MRLIRTLAHPWNTRRPALCRVRAKWKSVLLDQQPSLLTLRRRACRLCSNDSSVICRCPTPRRRARGPYGLSLLPPSCGSVAATGVSEVSRFSCLKFLGVSGVFDYAGLNTELALSFQFMLPSAHYKDVGVRVASFRSSIAHPTYSPVYASPCTSRCANAKLGAERIATPYS